MVTDMGYILFSEFRNVINVILVKCAIFFIISSEIPSFKLSCHNNY